MNSLVRVFSNFREFYSEINGATLTGAIDVIVVEQPDGTFMCSPFHVRFGKLGVLRSREKVVDIEINGEPVDIHMKLGESGEAFFVEECPEDVEEIPDNLATSPIPTNEFQKYEESKATKYIGDANDEISMPLPIPRRNSIDFSTELNNDDGEEKRFENQISDFSHRRHTDKMERSDLSVSMKQFTTQKIRQEWAVHEDQLFPIESIDNSIKEFGNSNLKSDDIKINLPPVSSEAENTEKSPHNETIQTEEVSEIDVKDNNISITASSITASPILIKDDSKSKKRRRKKSLMKKKTATRKSSSSSSLGSVQLDVNDQEPDGNSNNTNSSNDESSSKIEDKKTEQKEPKTGDESSEQNTVERQQLEKSTLNRIRDLDIHFFSDTEIESSGFNVRTGFSMGSSRPSTPIQSDSELEISQRGEKNGQDDVMTNSASWKWGELPTTTVQSEESEGVSPDAKQQAQRNSMLSGMFSFMKKNNKMRKNANDGVYLSDLDTEGMDPEMLALYFPPINKETNLHGSLEDDRESGNGTSIPHSPNSMEGQKSLDSDYDDGKSSDKYLDFVSLSLCGGLEKGPPSDDEFNREIVKYSEVCKNPAIFGSPNLVVRLNGKYYSWTAACPIVMTIITFQKPLSNEAIEKLMSESTKEATANLEEELNIKTDHLANTSSLLSTQETKSAGYSWWSWRRGGGKPPQDSKDGVDNKLDSDHNAVATQASRSSTPDAININANDSKNFNLSTNSDLKTAELILTNDDSSKSQNLSQDRISKNEKYRKTLRLSSEQIKSLNLKSGVNEIEFSVTTAYQGTSRCKCYLFRWKHNDKVVISDIDGTITKSDVLGHILPMVGKDWAQIGVAQLFSKIEENGYKLLYLSARAIGQSRATREYLRSIRQGDVKLPDGPLLLNPTSLISAFHREVIERKPEQFKIACLSDIQALFPEKNPFYAGYGNRINDVWAYRAVGIPIMRIFTINTKGELKHELTQTFQSSYCSMTYIVDQLFPPIRGDEASIEYSNFNYWRDPVQDIEIELVTNCGTSMPSQTAQTAAQNIPITTKSLPTIPEN